MLKTVLIINYLGKLIEVQWEGISMQVPSKTKKVVEIFPLLPF